MDLNHELLDRLRAAHRRELAISIGLAAEIIEQTRFVSRCAMEAHEARSRAEGRDPRRAGLSPEQANDALNAAAEQRRALHETERAAGRAAISEQSVLGAVADAAQRAGVSVDRAVAEYARVAAQPNPEAARRAWAAAAAIHAKAEKQLAELEAERSAHGRRAGQLRQTLVEAEQWLTANGLAMEQAA